MKSNYCEQFETAIRDHIVNGLEFLHEKANVGDQLLELGKHGISYSDGAEYNVTALHWDTTQEPTDMLRFYQEEEDSAGEDVENYPVRVLETDKLIELLDSLESITGCVYDNKLMLPKELKDSIG